MSRERSVISASPARPEDGAALNAALDALDFNLATPFQRVGNCMGSADMLAAAPAMTRPYRKAFDERRPVHPEGDFTETMRRHLENINRRILGIGSNLDTVDAAMVAAIDKHLEDIGLDNINPNRNEEKTL